MIIGILGFAQTGKDTIANLLAEHGAQKIGFADELKRITMQLFGFTPEQMWGTKEQKEAPDLRYPRLHSITYYNDEPGSVRVKCLCCGLESPSDDIDVVNATYEAPCYLNGRYALKTLGTEGARACWDGIWVQKAVQNARGIERGLWYDVRQGFGTSFHDHAAPTTAVFIDCRFENEVVGIQAAGGRVYRIKRPGYEKPMFDHPSETEQLRIPDDKLQGVIHNDGTLEDLKAKAIGLLSER
jgi:hypothetical protein